MSFPATTILPTYYTLLCKHTPPSKFSPTLRLLPSFLYIDLEVEKEEEKNDRSSEDEEEDMCAEGEHKWGHGVCMICTFCGFCTGYGPDCSNGRLPRSDVGM